MRIHRTIGCKESDGVADVIVGFKVMPKTVEENLDELEKKIREAIQPNKIDRQPIAFGLVAFLLVKIVQDEAGAIDAIEQKLRAIDAVGEVEVTGMTRSL